METPTEPPFTITLQESLGKLTIYELRAMYYLCRVIIESDHSNPLVDVRATYAIEALVGELGENSLVGLYHALMRHLAAKDPDMVARQAIQEAYQENTEGRV